MTEQDQGKNSSGIPSAAEPSGPIAAKRRPPFLIVGIGASAGGLAAFQAFFANMPTDTGMAFVLVQHLNPDHKSMLVELLLTYTAMPVIEAGDEVGISENRVFVIPPDATLTMENNHLRVTKPAPARPQRRPIDTFFSSLAENQEECAVGIILSGVGSDGTLGVRAIKEHGGFTLAQAEFGSIAMSGMPHSAAATGLVDCIIPVEAMPARLIEHQKHLTEVEPRKDADGTRQDARERLSIITSLLRDRIDHDFSGYKEKTLTRRVQRRMQVLQIETVPGYIEHLRREASEADALFRELLIGVTQFFRDPDAFEALKSVVLPSLLAIKQAGDPVRLWVPGCATGEEVYSIAILLKEVMGEGRANSVALFGTDIDPAAVAIARAGRYRKMDGLSPERLQRWFVKEADGSYCPLPPIREMCLFSVHSLVKDPPFSKLDLISCRNVLIYLGSDFQQHVLRAFHYGLRSGGYLFLGPSESVNDAKLFTAIDKKHRIMQRRAGGTPVLPKLQLTTITRRIEPTTARTPHPENVIEKSARRVMEKYLPAYFIVDKHHEILRLSGDTRPYLEPSPGEASLNLFRILAKTLRSPVRAALQQALRLMETVAEENLWVRFDGQSRRVRLIVEPIGESRQESGLCVVAFQEYRPFPQAALETNAEVVTVEGSTEVLQQELRVARASLQTASDDMESYVAQMQSATAEYQSVNEELVSSNEELETAKEEAQSINEELQTINSELHGKNELLAALNSDLQNLLDSTQIATIFLTDDLRIRNFTPAVTDLFPLRESDLGRALTDIVTRLTYEELQRDMEKVQRTLATIEREVKLKDETATFIMRIRPYRTVKNVIDGVVITFVDITERIRQDEQLRLAMHEMLHRTNNLLAVVQAMARQTAQHTATFAEFHARFGARLEGLAQSNSLLTEQNWKGVLLSELVQTQLAAFIDSDQTRLEMDGPSVTLSPEAAQTIGLALHELATNASKHGALSVQQGKISVHWEFTDTDPEGLRLIWQERGGPIVKPPERSGFGRFVIEQMVKRALNATVAIDLAPEGIVWKIEMPTHHVNKK